jgi:O-antigen/teichoic acid export membrane protein
LLLLTQDLTWYPILLISSALIGYIWFSVRVLTGVVIKKYSFRSIFDQFRGDIVPALTVLTAGGYTSITVTLVTAATTLKASTEFVSADKLYRLATQAIAISGNAFQGWVSEHEDADIRKNRMRSAICLNVGLGLVGGLGLSVLGPSFTTLMFSSELAVGYPVMTCFGLAYFLLSVNSALGRFVLTPLNLNTALLMSTVAGAVFGVPGIIYGATAYGALGAALAVASAELLVTLVQLGALGRHRRNRREVGLAFSSEVIAKLASVQAGVTRSL